MASGPGVEPADQRGAVGVAAGDRVEQLAGCRLAEGVDDAAA